MVPAPVWCSSSLRLYVRPWEPPTPYSTVPFPSSVRTTSSAMQWFPVGGWVLVEIERVESRPVVSQDSWSGWFVRPVVAGSCWFPRVDGQPVKMKLFFISNSIFASLSLRFPKLRPEQIGKQLLSLTSKMISTFLDFAGFAFLTFEPKIVEKC